MLNLNILFKKTLIIYEIINQIELKNWNLARELWIREIINYDFKITRNSISLFGSEEERFVQFMFLYQRHILIQICSINCSKNNSEFKRYS